MLINFSTTIKAIDKVTDMRDASIDADGKQVLGEPITLGRIAIMALSGAEKDADAMTRYKNGKLQERIYEAELSKEPIDISVEEIAPLKKHIATLTVNDMVIMRCFDLLEGK